jgi:preprotein translocase subunit SecF
MEEIEQIKRDIEEIKERNRRVEKDKAWETSITRKVLVAILTYIVVILFFFFAKLPKPFLNAIVPTIGFLLSTFSVSFVKKVWLKNKLKNNK